MGTLAGLEGRDLEAVTEQGEGGPDTPLGWRFLVIGGESGLASPGHAAGVPWGASGSATVPLDDSVGNRRVGLTQRRVFPLVSCWLVSKLGVICPEAAEERGHSGRPVRVQPCGSRC